MSTLGKKSKLSDLINYRLRILLVDGRTYIGTLLAFDAHLNVVLSDAEDVRFSNRTRSAMRAKAANTNNADVHPNSKGKDAKKNTISIVGNNTTAKEERRALGLIILRGEQIVSVAIECGPAKDARARLTTSLEKGRGVSRPIKTPVSVRNRGVKRTNEGT